jgi:hypothetical protein
VRATANDDFHSHLDKCERCAKQPFNLCPVGSRLLNAAAAQACPFWENPPGWEWRKPEMAEKLVERRRQ